MSEILSGNLVHFVRYLRAKGLGVVPSTTNDLVAATRAVGLADRNDIYFAFRALTVSRPSQLPIYDEAFELFFGAGARRPRAHMDPVELRMWDQAQVRAVVPVLRSDDAANPDVGRDDVEEMVGTSDVERLSRKDFQDLTPEEVAEVQHLIAQMFWHPADTPSRRHTPSRRGRRPDLRRTFRRINTPEGELLPLALRDRKLRKRPLVVIADISGSMEKYTEMFLYFIHAAQGRLGKVEAFVFSTQLTRITHEIRHRDPHVALQHVSESVYDWSGGTRIGEAFRTFNWEWSRRVTRGGAIALIISDGWDCGDPAVLDEEMGRLARSVHRVIWLNPLAGREGYQPLTRGMVTVGPYIDDFVPAASVNDLRALVHTLERLPARRGAKAGRMVS